MSKPERTPVPIRRRPDKPWVVGLALVAFALAWCAHGAVSHRRGESQDSRLISILGEQLASIDSATYNTRMYVRNDNPYYKSDYDEDVELVQKNWDLAQSLSPRDGALQAGLREADQEFEAVCARLDLAMQARDEHQREKGLNMLDSDEAKSLTQSFGETVSDMIAQQTQARIRDHALSLRFELMGLGCFVALLGGCFAVLRGRRPSDSGTADG